MTVVGTEAVSIEAVRARFPSLDGPVVRLDGPAGSQVPTTVVEAIAEYLHTTNANLGGAYAQSITTAKLVTDVRERLAGFLGADTR